MAIRASRLALMALLGLIVAFSAGGVSAQTPTPAPVAPQCDMYHGLDHCWGMHSGPNNTNPCAYDTNGFTCCQLSLSYNNGGSCVMPSQVQGPQGVYWVCPTPINNPAVCPKGGLHCSGTGCNGSTDGDTACTWVPIPNGSSYWSCQAPPPAPV
jgi:hypothetical protein